MASTGVGGPIDLYILATSGSESLYPEIRVLLGTTLVTTLDPVSVGGGLYRSVWTPSSPGLYTAVGQFFIDPPRTIDAGMAWSNQPILVELAGVQAVPENAAPLPAPVPEASAFPEESPEFWATGIFQSDLILRTALTEGIKRMRNDPDQISVVFRNLVNDDLTSGKYGGTESAAALAWFRAVNIEVVSEHRVTPANAIQVSVAQADEQEAETTLADLHYETSEPDGGTGMSRIISGVFQATHWDPRTGVLGVPSDITDTTDLLPGLEVLDSNGKAWVISEVPDDGTAVLADPGIADFSSARLRLPVSKTGIPVESQKTRETYRVGCHVNGDPGQLLWLHAVVRWVLLRYKQELLEARGFERTTTASGPAGKDERFSPQNVYTRYITVTGFVSDSWTKDAEERLLGSRVTLQADRQEIVYGTPPEA